MVILGAPVHLFVDHYMYKHCIILHCSVSPYVCHRGFKMTMFPIFVAKKYFQIYVLAKYPKQNLR